MFMNVYNWAGPNQTSFTSLLLRLSLLRSNSHRLSQTSRFTKSRTAQTNGSAQPLVLRRRSFSRLRMKKSTLPLHSATGAGKNQTLGKEALVKLLRWHFGHPEFRGKQLEAIEAVLSGLILHRFNYIWFRFDAKRWRFVRFQEETVSAWCRPVAGSPCVIRFRRWPRRPALCLLCVLW